MKVAGSVASTWDCLGTSVIIVSVLVQDANLSLNTVPFSQGEKMELLDYHRCFAINSSARDGEKKIRVAPNSWLVVT